MNSNRNASGIGLALLLAITAVTLASAYFFIAKTWWMPAPASAGAAAIDRQFAVSYLLMGTAFLGVQLALAWFVWRYRDRGTARATYSHGNERSELIAMGVIAVVFFGLSLAGAQTWMAARRPQPSAPDAVEVEVTGIQFAWYFRYPGPDGKFGKLIPKQMDASLGNESAIGLDINDPAGADDVVSSALILPVGREAHLMLRATDVIHDLFIPAMRVKQDAVPGLATSLRFRPTQIGTYDATCAELCGLGHYRMKAVVRVVSRAEYEQWLAARVAERKQ